MPEPLLMAARVAPALDRLWVRMQDQLAALSSAGRPVAAAAYRGG